jgi:hypothetical protein
MMKQFSFALAAALGVALVSGIVFGGCQDEDTKAEAMARQKGAVVELPDMPSSAQPTAVEVNDLNFWAEGKYFIVVGVVDDRSSTWSRIWIKLNLLDQDGEALKFEGEKEITVPTFSDGVPPRGRTSFFAAFPLEELNGKPVKASIVNAYSVPVDPGPILIVSEFSGLKILTQAKPTDTVATVESGWSVGGFVDNPLPQYPCNNLRGEVLVYGTDEKLYLSQLVLSDGESPSLVMEKKGPIMPGEKRRVGTSVMYAKAPRILDSVKIGRVELQPFDARPLKQQ